jgi:3-hydroxybutyryl-CoA dehydratase
MPASTTLSSPQRARLIRGLANFPTAAKSIKSAVGALPTTKPEAGQKATYQRTFTTEDVRAFAELSGDRGIHHMEADAKGRVMVQGLLTATIPTKLGGDMNYIARHIVYEFVRPVYVGDTITCEGTVEKVETSEGRLNVSLSFLCRNQDGKEVLRGTTDGIIRL